MQKDNEYGRRYAEAYKSSEPEIDLVIEPTFQAMVTDWDREQKILDVGTGTGRQIRLLKKLGFQHIFGIDNSLEMLTLAKNGQLHKLALMSDENLAFSAQSFEYLTMGNVLQDFEHKKDLEGFLQEIVRVLKPGGKMLITTPTPESYSIETVGFDASRYPENLSSIAKGEGSPVKVLVKKTGAELTDYIWLHEELVEMFSSLGLCVKAFQTPLANQDSSMSWVCETTTPAWALYLLQHDIR